MNQKYLFWLAVILASYFLVSNIIYWWQKDVRWDAVPEDAAVIIDLKDSFSIDEQLGSIADIYPFQQLQKDIALLDSLEISKTDILAVLQGSTPETFNWLFIYQTEQKLGKIVQKYYSKIRTSTLYDTPVYAMADTFAFAEYEDLRLLARYPLQVELAIEQLVNHPSIWKQKNLRRLYQLENNSGLACFISIKNLPNFLAPYLESTQRTLVQSLLKLRNWVRIDMQRDSIETRVLGQWLAEEKVFQNFTKGSKKEAKILNILPDNTAFCAWGNLSELLKTKQIQLPQLGKLWEEVESEAVISFSENYAGKKLPPPLIALRLKHEGAGMEYLQELTRLGNIQPEDYQMFQIFEVRDGLFSHFVQLQDYLVFSQSKTQLATYLDKYIAGQVLANDIDFLRAISERTDQTTAAFYFNTQRILPFLQSLFKVQYAKPIRQNIRALLETEGLHLSFTNSARFEGKITQAENLTYTSIAWRTPLETKAVSAPQLLTFGTKKHILIQDALHKLYCLDEGGKVLWTKILQSPILSDFQAIDFYDNGQQQYFFNTAEAVYLIDEAGVSVGAFPMNLQSKATNGLRVIDFDQTGFHHFLLACENGNIYGFDQNGRPLEHWSPRFIGLVVHPIEHFQWEQKDYVLILDQIGKLHILQRDANERFTPQAIKYPRKASLDYQIDNEFPRIIIADTTALVRVVHPRGEAFNLPLEVGKNKNVQFVFADVWGDKRKDYTVLSEREIVSYAYDQDGFGERLKYQFDYPQDAIFEANFQSNTYVGSLSQQQEQITLLNSQQRPARGFPLAGTTPFILHDLFGQEEKILISGNRASVVAYRIFD